MLLNCTCFYYGHCECW